MTGFFSKNSHAEASHGLGDSELSLRQFAVVREQIEKHGLVEQVKRVGKSLQDGVARASDKSSRITGTRGVGTQIWIDTASHQDATQLHSHLRHNGVLVKLNGARGVIARPALTLEEHQTSALTNALGKF